MKRYLFLALIALGFLLPASSQVINCPSGFSSSGPCGVAFIGLGGKAFQVAGGGAIFPSLSGSAVNLVPKGDTHLGNGLTYQTRVNVQSFTSSFTFVPNGSNVAFVIQNNTNTHAGPAGPSFFSGAGCEGGFFQAFGASPTYPNNILALELDSWSYLGSIQEFTYSSAMIYHEGQSPCNPNDNGPGYALIDKISTSPVPLNSPANAQGTTTGDTYSATITYNGTNLTLNLYNVSAGGSCPGANCFSHTWTGVDIPALVGRDTAYVGFTAGIGELSPHPLYIKSLSYSEGSNPQAAAPTFSPAAGKYSGAQSVTISDANSGATIYYTTNGNAPITSSTRYTVPITVSSTETLKAIAVGPGDAHSTAASATYTIATQPSVAPEAIVYDTLAAGTYAYDASSSGKLTVIEGSPFRTSGSLIGTNGPFLLTQGSGYVYVYQVESNGGIGRLISKIDTQLFSGSDCGSSPREVELDRAGTRVYALLAGKACSAIQTFEIGETGKLTFKGSTNPGDGDIVLPAVTGNDKFAYSISSTAGSGGDCCHFTNFARESTGVLKVISAHDTNPEHKPGTAAYSPVSNPTPDKTDHFALTVEPQGGGLQQLASYTVDSEGNTKSTNTWENMPKLPNGVYDMVLNPTGKILAVATGHDIQFFHFNGAKPVTLFTVIGISGYIKTMAWDNLGHLYAQDGASGEMYVYEVTTTSVKELSGSPTAIPQGTFAVRTR